MSLQFFAPPANPPSPPLSMLLQLCSTPWMKLKKCCMFLKEMEWGRDAGVGIGIKYQHLLCGWGGHSPPASHYPSTRAEGKHCWGLQTLKEGAMKEWRWEWKKRMSVSGRDWVDGFNMAVMSMETSLSIVGHHSLHTTRVFWRPSWA